MADRYNFSIRTTVKHSSTAVSFLTGHCANEGAARSLANTLNDHLPNGAKISLSKVIAEAPDFSAPDDLTDVAVVSFGLRKTNSDGSTAAQMTVKVPLPYAKDDGSDDYSVQGMQAVGQALLDNLETEDGTKMDTIAFVQISPKNIVAGGAVQ